MAVMSRKKKAVAHGWDAVNKQREEYHKSKNKKEKDKVSEEEHERRLKKLREIGLIK